MYWEGSCGERCVIIEESVGGMLSTVDDCPY